MLCEGFFFVYLVKQGIFVGCFLVAEAWVLEVSLVAE